MKIKAFKGLRPAEGKAADIASLPYDVVNFEQACKEAEGKPLSFMRVVRSELELDPSIDPYSPAVYEHAKQNFQKLVDAGNLIREDAPCMYLYRQQMGSHSQTTTPTLSKSTKKPARRRRTTATTSRAPFASTLAPYSSL